MIGVNKWKKSVEFFQGPIGQGVDPYDQDETEHIRIADIKGPWHPKMAHYLLDNGVKGLRLCHGNGFVCDDYSFLADLGHLELLSLLATKPQNYSGPMPISDLIKLKRLSVPFKHRQEIDFARLPNLQSCTIKWSKKVDNIFRSQQLKRLQLRSLNWQHTDGLANLRTLENLELSHSGIRSIDPVGELDKLQRLSLQVCHSLENLDGIAALQNLRSLNLNEALQITSLDCLAALKNLEILTVVDAIEIQSLAPLAELRNLKAIWIAGARTKIVDGDLSPLTRLPKLAMLTLAKSKNQSHKVIKRWNWDNLDHPDKQLEMV